MDCESLSPACPARTGRRTVGLLTSEGASAGSGRPPARPASRGGHRTAAYGRVRAAYSEPYPARPDRTRRVGSAFPHERVPNRTAVPVRSPYERTTS